LAKKCEVNAEKAEKMARKLISDFQGVLSLERHTVGNYTMDQTEAREDSATWDSRPFVDKQEVDRYVVYDYYYLGQSHVPGHQDPVTNLSTSVQMFGLRVAVAFDKDSGKVVLLRESEARWHSATSTCKFLRAQ